MFLSHRITRTRRCCPFKRQRERAFNEDSRGFILFSPAFCTSNINPFVWYRFIEVVLCIAKLNAMANTHTLINQGKMEAVKMELFLQPSARPIYCRTRVGLIKRLPYFDPSTCHFYSYCWLGYLVTGLYLGDYISTAHYSIR